MNWKAVNEFLKPGWKKLVLTAFFTLILIHAMITKEVFVPFGVISWVSVAPGLFVSVLIKYLLLQFNIPYTLLNQLVEVTAIPLSIIMWYLFSCFLFSYLPFLPIWKKFAVRLTGDFLSAFNILFKPHIAVRNVDPSQCLFTFSFISSILFAILSFPYTSVMLIFLPFYTIIILILVLVGITTYVLIFSRILCICGKFLQFIKNNVKDMEKAAMYSAIPLATFFWLMAWIPFIYNIIQVWMVFMLILAISNLYEISKLKALILSLFPFSIFVIISVIMSMTLKVPLWLLLRSK